MAEKKDKSATRASKPKSPSHLAKKERNEALAKQRLEALQKNQSEENRLRLLRAKFVALVEKDPIKRLFDHWRKNRPVNYNVVAEFVKLHPNFFEDLSEFKDLLSEN